MIVHADVSWRSEPDGCESTYILRLPPGPVVTLTNRRL